jgi:uncharacterized protein
MRVRDLLIGSAVAGGGLVVGFSVYGALQVISPRRSEHRDDPGNWGLSCEETPFVATDGTRLVGWLAESPLSRAAIIVLHGHGGNRHTSLAFAKLVYPAFSVFLPDLRGHGESSGRHTSVGYLERLDVVGAARFLRSRGFGPIGVLGVSMGAATAILAAAESELIEAVVADSSFATLRSAVREGARLRGYPDFISTPLAYLSCQTAAWRLRFPMQASDPLRVVGSIAPRPLLIIHGQEDRLILVSNAELLYAAAQEPKELWTLPEVGHARALETVPEVYQQRVAGFFRRWLLREPASGGAGSDSRPLDAGAAEVGEPAAQAGAGQVDQIA